MTRTLGIVAVLLAVSVASAAEPVGFALSGVVDNGTLGAGIPVAPLTAGSVTVNLLSAGSGTVGGMQAYLEVAAPASFTAAKVENIGGVFTNPGTSSAEYVDISSGTFAVLWDFGASATIAVPAQGVLATVTIAYPALPAGTKLLLTTQTSNGTSTWDTGADTAQASTFIIATPEPVSALLLLAGLPLIRRRR